MIIEIKAFASNAFTKYGKLRKNAPAEMGRMLGDVEPFTPNAVDDFLSETATLLKTDYDSFTSPYVFSCIEARNKKTNEAVRIFEKCNGFPTSPVKLLALLNT